jgi:hypothetical protein
MLPFTPIFELEDFRSRFDFDGSEEKILFSNYEGKDVEAVIAEAQSVSKKPPCIVGAWVIIDLDLDETQAAQLEANGINPTVLYSQFLIDDVRERWPLGSHVFSTPVTNDLGNGLLETGNTLYVLWGNGYRMRMSLDHAARIKESV